MTMVVTNLGNARESARLLRFEPTLGITQVNVQKAIEAVFGGGGGGGGGIINPTLVTTTPYSPSGTDTILWVTRPGPVVINLPTAVSRGGSTLLIKDVSGAANTNNITITHNVADTYAFDGQATLVINSAYGGFRLDPKVIGATNGWVIDP